MKAVDDENQRTHACLDVQKGLEQSSETSCCPGTGSLDYLEETADSREARRVLIEDLEGHRGQEGCSRGSADRVVSGG